MSGPENQSTAGVQDPTSFRYLCDEIVRFRQIFGSKKYTRDQMDAAFKGLAHTYLSRFSPKNEQEKNQGEVLFLATSTEWTRRQSMMDMLNIDHLFAQLRG